MLDLERIQGFDWDDGNAQKSVERHRVGQSEAEQIFFNDPVVISEDRVHSVHEPRQHALGHTDTGRLLHVTFTLRNDATLIRVISARPMNRKERTRCDEEIEAYSKFPERG
jgi:uncharacterized DUF497 family protein